MYVYLSRNVDYLRGQKFHFYQVLFKELSTLKFQVSVLTEPLRYIQIYYTQIGSQCSYLNHGFIFLQEADEIQFESYSRIEHVITGFWLHAMRGTVY